MKKEDITKGLLNELRWEFINADWSNDLGRPSEDHIEWLKTYTITDQDVKNARVLRGKIQAGIVRTVRERNKHFEKKGLPLEELDEDRMYKTISERFPYRFFSTHVGSETLRNPEREFQEEMEQIEKDLELEGDKKKVFKENKASS